eukprot:CAMPEP_0167821076 /NCGR_PEP_ID=MMETSP0112_2-20121227/6530_1 /TAXON_ID=91324 /ORGANISM="Lotharella globosa, Strain CCCM811" /LENGTH=163 /DNA_ID=CAMNT_0007721873 /DNA_START=370 /DNA_END=861 /DNA_ORIENTATION=-
MVLPSTRSPELLVVPLHQTSRGTISSWGDEPFVALPERPLGHEALPCSVESTNIFQRCRGESKRRKHRCIIPDVIFHQFNVMAIFADCEIVAPWRGIAFLPRPNATENMPVEPKEVVIRLGAFYLWETPLYPTCHLPPLCSPDRFSPDILESKEYSGSVDPHS